MNNLLEQAIKAEKKQKEILEKRALDYIKEKDGKIICDWESLAEKNDDIFLYKGDRKVFQNTYKAVLQELRKKGKLKFEYVIGAYFLLSTDRMDASPRDKDGTVYWFGDFEEAEKFKKAWYKNVHYGVGVAQLIKY